LDTLFFSSKVFVSASAVSLPIRIDLFSILLPPVKMFKCHTHKLLPSRFGVYKFCNCVIICMR
jgi:hypothetical protein